ncbi:MAG: hypothetical protein ABIP90_02700 [Vicinamibacterales bacterium]
MTAPVTPRVAAFDRLRGLIMVLMAIDHASFFIARVHAAETWAAAPPYYADLPAFLTRWLTHLCAPGFFMLMGIGIVWFGESRRAAGWSPAQIAKFFVTRGGTLLLVQHFLENPAWLLGVVSADPALGEAMNRLPGVPGDVMLGFAVLSALGFAMIVWGICWRSPVWAIVVICGGALGLSRVMIPDASAATQAIVVWKLLFFVPGQGGIVQNLYPWVIWLVPAGVGVALGRVFLRRPERIPAAAGVGAVVGVCAFVVMRVTGQGEYHELTRGLIGWLTVTKYPPSEAFLALMLGLDLGLLAAMSKWPRRWMAIFEVYGRVPFFFYLAHLYAFGVLSWAFRSGTSRPVMYLVWAVVVAALYPACAAYARVKFAKPATSLWRMF